MRHPGAGKKDQQVQEFWGRCYSMRYGSFEEIGKQRAAEQCGWGGMLGGEEIGLAEDIGLGR